MNTPSGGGRSVAGTKVGSSSGRYNNVGNVAAPMNTPSNSSRSVAGSSSANTPSDPYSIPWTDTQRMRNELDDLETEQNDLLVLNGGYMTTDILPQYRAYQDKIDQLNKKLAGADTSVQNVAAPMNTPGSGGRFATIGDAYVDFLEQEGVVFKDSAANSAGANGVNPSDPYSIPWTEEQEKRKRLSDAQIQRDNLLDDMGDNPTKEDIIAPSEYDATINR